MMPIYRKLIACFILYIVISPAPAQSQTWKATAFTSGDIGSFVQVKSTGNLIAGSSDGIYVSTDQGKNFVLALPTFGGNSHWQLTADAAGHIYGHDEDIFMCRSLDAGTTWQYTGGADMNQAFGGALLYMFTTTGGSVYGSTIATLHRSVTEALSWSVVGEGLAADNPAIEAMAETSDGTLFAGSGGEVGGNIYRSTDDGDTFTEAYTGAVGNDIQALTVTSSGVIVASVNGKGILQSTDNGDHWESFDLNAGAQGQQPTSFSYRGSELISQINDGVYGSNDNGKTWHRISGLPSQGETNSINTDLAGTIYAATTNGLYKLDTASVNGVELNTHVSSRGALTYTMSREALTVTATTAHDVTGSISLIDLLGRTQLVLYDGLVLKTGVTATSSTASLKSGAYLIVLRSNEGIRTERVLIIH